MKNTVSDYQSVDGIIQFTAPRTRLLLTPGWHHFKRVSAFTSSDGTRYRKAAVFVGCSVTYPEGSTDTDPRLEDHETGAASITDGDVYTTQCHRAHALEDYVGAVLKDAVEVENVLRADWAICQGAAYHSDEVFEELFGLFHVAGTPGELHFPRLGCKVYMTPGSWVIFDSAEPHGFTNDGAEVFDAQSNMALGLSRFLSVGLAFDESAPLIAAFEYQRDGKSRALKTNRFEVDEFTGKLSRLSREAD